MRYLLIALALIPVAGCRSEGAKPGAAAAKPAEVTVLSVTAREVPVSYEFVAQTQSSRQVEGGVAPYVTVLQAEQQLFPAELDEVQLRAALLAATVRIYVAMGGGSVEAGKRTR